MKKIILICLFICLVTSLAFADNKKFLFIHHSTGGNLIADTTGSDGKGGLAEALDTAGYFVSDICYQWDATANTNIGDYTDIGHWYTWFVDTTDQSGTPRRDNILGDAYTEYDQDAYSTSNYGSRTRTVSDPGGENEIIMIKSCYPNADIYTDNDTVPADLYGGAYNIQAGGEYAQTVSNTKALYNQLMAYFKLHPEKMFIVMTGPPLSSGNTTSERAANMRVIADWLYEDWRSDNSWEDKNVYVYDFFNILTDTDNHHMVSESVEYHHTEVDSGDYSVYAGGDGGGDHPTGAANRKTTSEFVDLLNLWHTTWQASLSPNAMKWTGTGNISWTGTGSISWE